MHNKGTPRREPQSRLGHGYCKGGANTLKLKGLRYTVRHPQREPPYHAWAADIAKAYRIPKLKGLRYTMGPRKSPKGDPPIAPGPRILQRRIENLAQGPPLRGKAPPKGTTKLRLGRGYCKRYNSQAPALKPPEWSSTRGP